MDSTSPTSHGKRRTLDKVQLCTWAGRLDLERRRGAKNDGCRPSGETMVSGSEQRVERRAASFRGFGPTFATEKADVRDRRAGAAADHRPGGVAVSGLDQDRLPRHPPRGAASEPAR